MRSFWSDPFLWIHAAGLAVFPLFLTFCLLGFAVGSPFLPPGLEVGGVALFGILPIFLMQWFRPFYIFSLLVVTLRPEKLSPLQLRLLTCFKTPIHHGLTIVTPVCLGIILWQLYRIAPLATEMVSFLPQWRLLGLFLTALAFLGANLFAQVSVSVLAVLLTSETAFEKTSPYPLEKITHDFSVLGWRVNRIIQILSDPPQGGDSLS